MLTGLRDRAAAAGIALEEMSVGATPTLRFSAAERGLTELRPGNYVVFRSHAGRARRRPLSDCALTVLATVVSKPAADRIILDCGSKTLTSDPARGFDRRRDTAWSSRSDGAAIDATLSIERLSEEHATVRVEGRRRSNPAIGFASCPITPASWPTWSMRCGWWTATA